jgi:hypothetical protein
MSWSSLAAVAAVERLPILAQVAVVAQAVTY